MSGDLEVALELLLVGWNLDFTQVRLLDENDLVAVAANYVGRLLVATVLGKCGRALRNEAY
jgi:hypothetical protein